MLPRTLSGSRFEVCYDLDHRQTMQGTKVRTGALVSSHKIRSHDLSALRLLWLFNRYRALIFALIAGNAIRHALCLHFVELSRNAAT